MRSDDSSIASIVSFPTGALYDGAVLQSAKLTLRRQGIVGGGNPITMFQGMYLDVRKGYFGTSSDLQASDFQTNPARLTIGPYTPVPVGPLYTITLPSSAFAFINKQNSGLTQIRLRFNLDDNNNAVANYIYFYSGSYGTAAYKPTLIVTYYIPQ